MPPVTTGSAPLPYLSPGTTFSASLLRSVPRPLPRQMVSFNSARIRSRSDSGYSARRSKVRR